MGREIRRVPPNWEHPRQKCEHSPWRGGCDEAKKHGGMCFKPLLDESYEEAVSKWKVGYAAWEDGTHGSLKFYREDDSDTQYWEYDSPPDREDYRPVWKEGEATWFQVYETVSEGTPVTPAFSTKKELVEYLVQHGDFWNQYRGEGGFSRAAAEAFVKDEWVPTLTTQSRIAVRFTSAAKCASKSSRFKPREH